MRNLKIKAKLLKEGTVCHGEITEEEIAHAELQWLRSVQKNLKAQANYGHLEHKFGLYEDENEIVRCQGRIANADLPYETRFPALLPRNHYISTLLVRQAHERVHHSKVAATLAQLRMRFWIVTKRQLVKKITSRCTVCRRYEGRGLKVPPQPDLPEFRLSQKPAFTYVGVDYVGPLHKGTKLFDNKEGLHLLQICQLMCLSVVCGDSQQEGACQKSLSQTMRKHLSLLQGS